MPSPARFNFKASLQLSILYSSRLDKAHLLDQAASQSRILGLLPATLALIALSGCGITPQNFQALPALSGAIQGTMHGGRAPITGTTVKVWAAGTGGYGSAATLLAVTTTDSAGSFGFAAGAYACPQGNTPVYITGQGGNPGLPSSPNSPTLVLAAGLGTCTAAKSTTVDVNEVTTIATAYALAQFFTTTLGGSSTVTSAPGDTTTTDAFGAPATVGGGTGTLTYSTGLSNANSYTIPTLVTFTSGLVNFNNPKIVPEGAKIYSLANALAACVNSTGGTTPSDPCGQLFTYTTPPLGAAPTDTLQAAVQMALFPYQNVTEIYNLGSPTSPYQYSGGLSSAPVDLTVGVAYTTNTFKLTINPAIGTSNLAVDAAGKVWLPSSSPAGVAVFDPSSNTFNGPYTSPSATAVQNIAIDHEGLIWVPDTSSVRAAAFTDAIPPTSTAYNTGAGGSVYTVAIASNDYVVVPANITGLGSRLGAVPYPRAAALLLLPTPQHQATGIAGSTEGGTYYYLATRNGTTGYMEVSQNQTIAGPFTIRQTYTGGGSGQIAQVAPTDFIMTTPLNDTACTYIANLCFGTGYVGMNRPQGVAIDGANYVWIANSGNASVTEFPGYSTTSVGYTGGNSGNPLHGSLYGNTMVQPYGIGIDPSGNVWVSNQTAAAAGSPYILSELIGAAAPTITPINSQIYGGANKVGTKP